MFNDGDTFMVLSGNVNISGPIIPPIDTIPSIQAIIPTASYSSPQFPSTSSGTRAPLFTVKVIKADVDLTTGKPCNFIRNNWLSNVPIYNEQDACLNYIKEYVKLKLQDDDIDLVQANGQSYQDEEGTRCKYQVLLFHFPQKFHVMLPFSIFYLVYLPIYNIKSKFY